MSESEEENCFYGTPLEPYDEDAFPKKKPIGIEEQVAKDAQGRRRFHGAFTGGFSAGFFNTVGSLEGWTPTEFRSSRSEKAANKQHVPEDYMDDEDLGEFGIAPQVVRATDSYTSGKKRKKQIHTEGPIPGIPVLETLLQAGNETVGYFLMKNMNRRHRQQQHVGVKVYGCAMPTDVAIEDIPTEEFDLHECYKNYLKTPKSNSFGLGYTSLDKTHLNLFQPAKLTVKERNNKKLSISGQAFGVGAFEEDDEDIYVKDDMTRYDFELTGEASSTKTTNSKNLVFDIFIISSTNATFNNKITFPPPVIPTSFTGKYKVRKSRFEPIATEECVVPKLNAAVRAKYLGENHVENDTMAKQSTPTPCQVKEKVVEPIPIKNEAPNGLLSDRFVSAKLSDDINNILEPVKKFECDHGSDEMRAAVRMKLFGTLTHTTLTWQPCALLCKKFNVPEPHTGDLSTQKRKRTKNLIFEYQKHEEKQVQHEPGLQVKPSTSFSQPDIINEIQETPSIETTVIEVNNSVSKTNETENKIQANATQIVDITDRLDVSQKTDLFKAVFLSSSESEASDQEAEEDAKNKELLTANVLSEPLVPKIKPIKEGILSNINFTKLQPKIEPEKPQLSGEVTDAYGPRLPSTLSKVTNTLITQPIINYDEWVEKDEVGKEKKHKKKHKKEKRKHKHKSKR